MQIKEQKRYNCIEVTGVCGLSAAYIKRFFGHVGQVQNIKKLEDKVIVRFRYASSVPKAYRYNGRVVDKQPIRIRNISTYNSGQQESEKKALKMQNIRQLNNSVSQQIKFGPLNLSYHWVLVERILGNFQDDGLRWLIYELFASKLTQIFNLYLYGCNQRSKYSEYSLKEMIFIHSKEKPLTTNGQNASTKKLQFNFIVPHDLQYETTYESWNYNMENRIRHRFIAHRSQGEGMKLFYLYMLFYKNSLKLEEGFQLLSESEPPEKNDDKMMRITLKEKTKLRSQLCIQEWLPKCDERSGYRSIDIQNPSKQIQIISDSCFHEGPSSATVFQLFKDDFDGCVDNSYCADIFHNFRPFFAPNYLLIKHSDSRKNQYIRLLFQLRILNCKSQIFPENAYSKFWILSQSSDYRHLRGYSNAQNERQPDVEHSKKLTRISQIILQKHNLIFGEFGNQDKILYQIEQYIDFYCISLDEEKSDEGKTDSQFLGNLTVIIVNTNPHNSKNQMQRVLESCDKSEKIRKSRARVYALTITNDEIFQKMKCRNYLETRVDSMKGNMTLQIARLRAKQLIKDQPQRFRLIQNSQVFVTNTIWQLYEQSGKRNAKNDIMGHIYKIRQ